MVKTIENEEEIRVYGENLNLELLNEKAPAFESNRAMTFVEYANHFGILNFGAITVNKNEIADRKRTLKWSGSDSKLKRLISIATQFDAEIEFETRLNNNSSLKAFILNIYKKNDGAEIQGVGKRRDDIRLTYKKNIKNVTRTVDKSNIATMIFPVGKKQVTKNVVTTTSVNNQAHNTNGSTYNGGNLNYGGNTLSTQTVNEILKLAHQYNILPSGMICQLYLESFWGKSQVAKRDNNWGGFTWGGNPNRRSGVVVSVGTARPANEGGNYMHFASVSDYMKDYAYTLKNGGYNVSGKPNIDEYTKGLFRVGGSVYDYAAAGYAHYINLMRDIRGGINRNNNNVLDRLDSLPTTSNGGNTSAPTNTIKFASQTKAALDDVRRLKGQHVGSGQCYALVAWYSNRLGGAGLGGGVTGFRGLIGSGMAAADIGGDYNWKQFGWGVVIPSQIEHLIIGSIYNVKRYVGAPFWTGGWGHTGVIIGNNGSTVTVLEQNYNNHQFVEEHQYNASAFLAGIQTLCYPPEIIQGKRVDGVDTPAQPTTNSSSSVGRKDVKTKEREETSITYIDNKRTKEWKNAKGEVEFFLKGGALYAPLAAKLYPAVLTGKELSDNWLRLDIEIDTTDEDKLIEEALKKLREVAYPSVTYDVNGSSDDLEIGDTVKIFDSGFNPTLTLQARVSEQTISFTNPSTNKTTFSNFRALENKVSSILTDRLEDMLEDLKPYELRLNTDNGLTFKNHTGRSVLRAELVKGNKYYKDATYQFTTGDTLLSAGLEYAVDGSSFDEQLTIVVSAYIGNDKVAEETIIFTNVSDGQKGSDGRSQVLHLAYANSEDGKTDFSILDSRDKAFIGQYSSFDLTPSSNPSDYKWSRFKGERGERGEQGLRGLNGKDGIAGPRGADGRTQYTFIAYSTDKTTIQQNPTSESKFIGIAQSFENTKPTNISAYTWSVFKGRDGQDGIQGPKGADGRTSYFHVAYADSADGRTGFVTSSNGSKRYMGTYTDFEQEDSHDPSRYHWLDTLAGVEKELASKADAGLTQEQLNALSERASLIQTELQAKASLDIVNNFIKEYRDFVNAEHIGKAKAEQDLQKAAERLTLIQTNLGEYKSRTDFIDAYMTSANEGLTIGKKDGSSSMLFSPNGRISMFSAGKEVMYIDKGVIHIDNGVFTKTLQIGRFKTMEYGANPDINVIRYVGNL